MHALNLSRNICVLLLVLNVAEVDGYTAKSYIKPIFWYFERNKLHWNVFNFNLLNRNILSHLGITILYFASLKAVYFCRHLRDHRMDYRWQ